MNCFKAGIPPPAIYLEAAILCRECKSYVPTTSAAFQALQRRSPSDARRALWSLGTILDQVLHSGPDTRLSSTQFRRLIRGWGDIRWWIAKLLNDFVLENQPQTPGDFDFQRNVLIIVAELSTYLDLDAPDPSLKTEMQDLCLQNLESTLELALRTWIYVLENYSEDLISSHCSAMISYTGMFKESPFRVLPRVLEKMPGSEGVILQTVVKELQKPNGVTISVFWSCLDAIMGCCLNETIFSRLLEGSLVRWLSWIMLKMTKLWNTEIAHESQFLLAIANCVRCLSIAFKESYSWISTAIEHDFFPAVLLSVYFVIHKRSEGSGQALEAALHELFTAIQPFLVYRSVLRSFLRAMDKAQRRSPELYRQLVDLPQNSEKPDKCFATAWKNFYDLAKDRQRLRKECVAAGYIMCAFSGCPKARFDSSISFELKECSRCQVTRYCSTDCQKRDWRRHRQECRDLRRRMVLGGRPAAYSHIDEQYLVYLARERGQRFYTSPQIEESLDRNPNTLIDKIINIDFRHEPPRMWIVTYEKYQSEIKKGEEYYTVENYNKLVRQSKVNGCILLIQGVFAGELLVPRIVVTGVLENDLCDIEDESDDSSFEDDGTSTEDSNESGSEIDDSDEDGGSDADEDGGHTRSNKEESSGVDYSIDDID
ncbi:hypothetical protein GYMLUDRAFT_40181 [Collybiopsis luxurians FD-317 M1]|uniref:MYND-type domain-containing protein n=1 Tax=Collybiopsis luxurians FD-317 M1 TaxID=944289 RepID=A0A0D0CW45_9AGAR|nr:hypothetical protein GYMLUDRAFT_40181 [Collybiopsis luxurians FD-317 M1]